MNSNNRCMRLKHFGFFGRASIARNTQTGSSACMLALRSGVDHKMKRSIKYLCLFAVVSFTLTAIAADPADRPVSAADQTTDAVQAKAKLAEIRGRIAVLTNPLRAELK